MHLSIWQQFSSNHSSEFTVVGRFETEESARDAAEKFRHLFNTISLWYSDHYQSWKQEWDKEKDPNKRANQPKYEPWDGMTPVEIEFSRQYDVDWGGEPIDWWGFVEIRGKDVFVTTAKETWGPSAPIEQLMQKFGADVQLQHTHGDFLSVHLTCNTISEAVAQSITDVISAYLKDRPGKPVPWRTKDDYEPVSAWGRIRRNGQQIILDLQFFELGYGLPALITYLEAQDCTNIQYSLTPEKEWLE